jgi:hypothetical protein
VPRPADIPLEMTSLPRYRIVDGVVSSYEGISREAPAESRGRRGVESDREPQHP